MATISGLPAPNPYAPPTVKPKPVATSANSSATMVILPERATLNHAAFTPDWMQDQAPAATVYTAKGELQRLPEPVSPALSGETGSGGA
jgi:hypothetical protein